MGYKGFDFNVFLHGIRGSSTYEGNYDRIRGGNYVLNQSTYVLNRWIDEENPGNGIVPRAVIGDPAQNNRPSTLKLPSGNYLKIKQLSVGYSPSKIFTDRIGIDNLRVYVSAYNFFTFTKYDYGYDPEVGSRTSVSNGGNLSRGFEGGNSFPRPKMFSVGIQVRL